MLRVHSFVVRSDHDVLRWLMGVSDPQGRLDRWRLSLSNFDLTVAYRPGLRNKVPDALSRCTTNDHDDVEVEDGITTFETGALVVKTTGAAMKDEMEDIPEENDAYDLWMSFTRGKR